MPDLFDDGRPVDETPMMHPFLGPPDSTFDLINRYGTYNIQPTCEQENEFPAIAQGEPQAQRGRRVEKSDLERQ